MGSNIDAPRCGGAHPAAVKLVSTDSDRTNYTYSRHQTGNPGHRVHGRTSPCHSKTGTVPRVPRRHLPQLLPSRGPETLRLHLPSPQGILLYCLPLSFSFVVFVSY